MKNVSLRKGLLGKPATEQLNIVQFSIPSTVTCGTINQNTQSSLRDPYPEIFHGLGHIKGYPLNYEIGENAKPFRLPASRQLAIPMLKPLYHELNRIEKLGVIRKVNKRTTFCHPIVTVPKPDKTIRVCLDLTKLY